LSNMPNAAPSWSWASIKGGIKYHSLLERVVPLVGIEEASTIPVASDDFGEVQGGFIEVKDRLFVFDGISKEKSLDLIHNGGYLRISLDDYLSTNNGQLYLAPLVKLQAEQQYWCLLVCQKLSNRVPVVPEYRRLGFVMINTERRQQNPLTGYALGTATALWPNVSYSRTLVQEISHPFTPDDFEGAEVQKFRLV